MVRFITAVCACLAAAVLLAAEEGRPDPKKTRPANPLRGLHLDDASEYKIFRDLEKKQILELRRQPVYVWTNPTRVGGQDGDVFVWTYRGRPEAVASIFSYPQGEERWVYHEFHSLSPRVIYPKGNVQAMWQPKSAAVLVPVPGAAKPAESPRLRLSQLKSLAREFSAYSLSPERQRWELRLQTTPLFSFEAGPETLGGALFSFVTSAGTDPELMLLIEARTSADGPRWMYTPARFSDYNLYLLFRDQQAWTAIRGPEDTGWTDAQRLYHLHADRLISDITRPQPTEKPGGS